ncbi:MAG: phosphoadenosine phosphosulfate reductase family protein [Kiritimatiellae bacterium]|nr:phosphoadenosine phosphosulfate reductase family protein [Kiritimatiellia bacterium]
MSEKVRHILSLSGGKDSSALAVFMKGKVPEMEYVFCDTGDELQETYEYLDKLEFFLGKKITRINADRPFKHYLALYNGVLPDARTRWCTRMLKIKPYEKFIGNDRVISYVGIRADEPYRTGYIATSERVRAVYPFVENNIRKDDVFKILEDSGVGVPSYYQWRSRSGCFFCFFQQRIEWVGLLERHPDLFKRAMAYEKSDPLTGERFTWVEGESLAELARPERIAEIKAQYAKRVASQKKSQANLGLKDVFVEEDTGGAPCMMCQL